MPAHRKLHSVRAVEPAQAGVGTPLRRRRQVGVQVHVRRREVLRIAVADAIDAQVREHVIAWTEAADVAVHRVAAEASVLRQRLGEELRGAEREHEQARVLGNPVGPAVARQLEAVAHAVDHGFRLSLALRRP